MGTRSVDGNTFNSTSVMCLKDNAIYAFYLEGETYLTWILIWSENETWTLNGGSHLWSLQVSYWQSSSIPVAWNPERTDTEVRKCHANTVPTTM